MLTDNSLSGNTFHISTTARIIKIKELIGICINKLTLILICFAYINEFRYDFLYLFKSYNTCWLILIYTFVIMKNNFTNTKYEVNSSLKSKFFTLKLNLGLIIKTTISMGIIKELKLNKKTY